MDKSTSDLRSFLCKFEMKGLLFPCRPLSDIFIYISSSLLLSLSLFLPAPLLPRSENVMLGLPRYKQWFRPLPKVAHSAIGKSRREEGRDRRPMQAKYSDPLVVLLGPWVGACKPCKSSSRVSLSATHAAVRWINNTPKHCTSCDSRKGGKRSRTDGAK